MVVGNDFVGVALTVVIVWSIPCMEKMLTCGKKVNLATVAETTENRLFCPYTALFSDFKIFLGR
jgi:hypothetical protein